MFDQATAPGGHWHSSSPLRAGAGPGGGGNLKAGPSEWQGAGLFLHGGSGRRAGELVGSAPLSVCRYLVAAGSTYELVLFLGSLA